MDLIKITEENGKQLVSARELYSILSIKTPFNKWAVRKITSNAFFQENEDYTRLDNYVRAGQVAMEFALTIDTAKKIAMAENNEQGNNVRDYFLRMEKKANSLPALTNTEILLQVLQSNIENEKKQLELENRIKAIEETPQINAPIQHFSILGHCNNIGKQINLTDAAQYGRKCTKLCRELGLTTGIVPDPRYGKVKTYPIDVLEQIIK